MHRTAGVMIHYEDLSNFSFITMLKTTKLLAFVFKLMKMVLKSWLPTRTAHKELDVFLLLEGNFIPVDLLV